MNMNGSFEAPAANLITPVPSASSSLVAGPGVAAAVAPIVAPIDAAAVVDGSVGPGPSTAPHNSDLANHGAPSDLRGSSSADSNGSPHHPIAEFLYQLTKMLTDDNREIIEWSNGRIKVHHPDRLEGEVLHKYFRHSKFASFQRQLNYFGFRKIAGKGKMSPCSYVNDAATSDIRSLLSIKRKTNGSAARKAALAQQRTLAAGVAPGAFALGNYSALAQAAAAGNPGVLSADLLTKAFAATLNPALAGVAGLHPGMLLQNNAAVAAVAQQQLAVAAAAAAAQQAATKPLGESLYFPSDGTLAALAQGQHMKTSAADLASTAKKTSNPSLDKINVQLQAALAQRQSALNLAAGLAPGAATAALSALPASNALSSAAAAVALPAPASAVASAAAAAAAATTGAAMPASAALNAGTGVANSQNFFESSANLSALVGKEDKEKETKEAPKDRSASGAASSQTAMPARRVSSQNLLNRLPSSSAIFPDTLSSISLTGLLPTASSNPRLSSVLSLSNFLSRDPSMVDFGLAAAAAATQPSSQYLAAFPGIVLPPRTAGAPGFAEPTPIVDLRNSRQSQPAAAGGAGSNNPVSAPPPAN